MNEFRVLVEVTTGDLDSLLELLSETTDSIDQHLPGTLVWDTFSDAASGRVLIYEVHRDESAADDYERHMESVGFKQRAFALFTSMRVVILSPVHGSIWSGIAALPSSDVLVPAVRLTDRE